MWVCVSWYLSLFQNIYFKKGKKNRIKWRELADKGKNIFWKKKKREMQFVHQVNLMDLCFKKMHKFSFLLVVLLLSLCVCFCKASVSYDHRAISINGQRRILISGSIHYPRSTPEVQLINALHGFLSFLIS